MNKSAENHDPTGGPRDGEKITRRRFVATTAAALAALPLGGLAATDTTAPKRPNVLFIAVDDLKPLLNCYGVSWIKSPNIDRLASRGTLFASNYCQAPLCAPSRSSLLTGLRPDVTGVYWNPFQVKNILRNHLPKVVTLPQHFADHGYVTCATGKVFDGRTVDEGHDTASWTQPYIHLYDAAPGGLGVRGYQNPDTKRRLSEPAGGPSSKPVAGPPDEDGEVPDNAYADGAMARTVSRKIKELATQPQPFFLAVGFYKPHLPFIAPRKYWDLYDRGTFHLAAFQRPPLDSPPAAQPIPNSGELRDYAGVPKSGPIAEAQQRELINGYAACVSYIDAQVGLLLDALEQNGVAGNTIICLVADHGWHLGEHGHWGKSTDYQDATHVPLIVSAPGLGEGVRTSSLTESLDIFPTLCDLAGLPKPAHVQGRSLVPVMRHPEFQLHEAAISQCCTVDSQMSPQLVSGLINELGTIDTCIGWAQRTPRYRYIEWRRVVITGSRRSFGSRVLGMELYDYEKDPLERENLAGKPEYAGVLKEQQALF